MRILAHTAPQTSVSGAYCAFTCALLVWAWQVVAFLLGVVVAYQGADQLRHPAGAIGDVDPDSPVRPRPEVGLGADALQRLPITSSTTRPGLMSLVILLSLSIKEISMLVIELLSPVSVLIC